MAKNLLIPSAHAFSIQSVRTFWQGVNWENRSSFSNSSVASNLPSLENISLNLAVGNYFALIPWSGVAIATPKPKVIEPKSETLADFLDDISKFF
jgi:hypothetical protein